VHKKELGTYSLLHYPPHFLFHLIPALSSSNYTNFPDWNLPLEVLTHSKHPLRGLTTRVILFSGITAESNEVLLCAYTYNLIVGILTAAVSYFVKTVSLRDPLLGQNNQSV